MFRKFTREGVLHQVTHSVNIRFETSFSLFCYLDSLVECVISNSLSLSLSVFLQQWYPTWSTYGTLRKVFTGEPYFTLRKSHLNYLLSVFVKLVPWFWIDTVLRDTLNLRNKRIKMINTKYTFHYNKLK